MMRVPRTRCVGYARELGRSGPQLGEQVLMLRHAGCRLENIWNEASDGRNALRMALIDARAGDVFVVAAMLCLGSLKVVGSILADFQKRNIAFRALAEKIDSRAWLGKDVVPHLIRAAEGRRSNDSESILIGLRKAREQGRLGGRRPVLSPQKRAEAADLIIEGKLTMAEIAVRLGVSRRTLYNEGLVSARTKRPKPV